MDWQAVGIPPSLLDTFSYNAGFHLPLGQSRIGSSVDNPAALTIENKNFKKQAGNTDVSKDLPERPDTTDTRHGTRDNLIRC